MAVKRLISAQLNHWEEHGYGWWAITPRPDLQYQMNLIGWGGLQWLPETEETEVAYMLGRDFWGQGLATEIASASLEYGFQRLGIERIVGIVHPENIASQRVLEKAGLVFDAPAHYFGMDCYHYTLERSSGK